MKHVITALVVLLVVVGLIVGAFAIDASNEREDKTKIDAWAVGRSSHVTKITRCYFRWGPFWLKGKSDRIYEVDYRDSHERPKKIWFRFGFWSYDTAE